MQGGASRPSDLLPCSQRVPPIATLADGALAYTHDTPIGIRYMQPFTGPESKRSSLNGFLTPALGRVQESLRLGYLLGLQMRAWIDGLDSEGL